MHRTGGISQGDRYNHSDKNNEEKTVTYSNQSNNAHTFIVDVTFAIGTRRSSIQYYLKHIGEKNKQITTWLADHVERESRARARMGKFGAASRETRQSVACLDILLSIGAPIRKSIQKDDNNCTVQPALQTIAEDI